MKMTFVGCGSAFNKVDGQSNVLLEKDGKKMLIDCGTYFWKDTDVDPSEIDLVYVTHDHADHVGGLEELAFRTYFNPNCDRPKLVTGDMLENDLWDSTLRGGLGLTAEGEMCLEDYFELLETIPMGPFVWQGVTFNPNLEVHVPSDYIYAVKLSFGLDFTVNGKKVYYTSDAFCECNPDFDEKYVEHDIIFHDCEMTPFVSGVHTHYNTLVQLPDDVKNRIWLYHYQPGAPLYNEDDGFAGIVKRGQVFEF